MYPLIFHHIIFDPQQYFIKVLPWKTLLIQVGHEALQLVFLADTPGKRGGKLGHLGKHIYYVS